MKDYEKVRADVIETMFMKSFNEEYLVDTDEEKKRLQDEREVLIEILGLRGCVYTCLIGDTGKIERVKLVRMYA